MDYSERPLEFPQQLCSNHVKCSSHVVVSRLCTLETCPLPYFSNQVVGICDFLQLVTNLWVLSCYRLISLKADTEMVLDNQVLTKITFVKKTKKKQDCAGNIRMWFRSDEVLVSTTGRSRESVIWKRAKTMPCEGIVMSKTLFAPETDLEDGFQLDTVCLQHSYNCDKFFLEENSRRSLP